MSTSHRKSALHARLSKLRASLSNTLSPKVGLSERNPDEYRIHLVTYYTALFGGAVHFLLIFAFWLAGAPGLMLLNVGSVMAWISGWTLNQRGHYVAAVLIMSSEVVIHCVTAVLVLGWSSGFQYYLLPAIPFILFNIYLKNRVSFPMAFGFGALFVGPYWLSTVVEPAPLSPRFITAMHYANAATCMASLVIVSYVSRLATMLNDRHLKEVARTDFLTGLRNRRAMMDLLEQQRLAAQREGSSFGVLLVDIDHFKAFNDRYGHDCGDYVLSEVARVMQSSIRGSDAVARWGGEEFLVMAPSTDMYGAHTVAEDLRAAIENQRMRFAGQPLCVTATVGVALHQGCDQSLEKTLKFADEALYHGKELGRNRVHLGEKSVEGEDFV